MFLDRKEYIAAHTAVPLRWLRRQAPRRRGESSHLFTTSSAVALEDLTMGATVRRQLRMCGGLRSWRRAAGKRRPRLGAVRLRHM